MEICRSRLIAHVPINGADADLYMNVKMIIVVIHSNMVCVSYATAYIDIKRKESHYFDANPHVCYYYLDYFSVYNKYILLKIMMCDII